MQNKYSIPKLKTYPLESGKPWFVWFRFNGGNPIRIKEYINKIPDYQKRLTEGTALANALHKKLQDGWNPTNRPAFVHKEKLTLNKAIDFALEKKKGSVTEITYRNYRNSANFFKETAKDLYFDDLDIEKIERFHIKTILEQIHEEREWTNKNFNKNLGYIKSLFTELVEWEYVKTNFCRDIRSKKEIKTEGYILPKDVDKRKIFAHLKEIDYNFFVFCCIEYYLGIRPKEILCLKCKDVDLEDGFIRIPAIHTKDKAPRAVPIFPAVLKLLEQIDLSEKDYYLFGRPKPYGCRFHKAEYFCPNPSSIKRDTATRKWKQYIIDGLGIDVKCYSLKHTGANDKLKAGMDLKTISQVFGHSDEKMTEIYANHINTKRFQEAKKVMMEEF